VKAIQEKLDCIVLGGGPAGLSAALVLGRCVRSVLVCDDGRYRNKRSQALHCFLGQDGVRPLAFLAQTRQQLDHYPNVQHGAKTAVAIKPTAEGMRVTFEDGSLLRSKTVLVATGVMDELPPLAGIDVLFGTSVHVCPFCDGWEHRDAPIAVYGRGKKGAEFANLLRQWTSDLILCTDGDVLPPRLVAALSARRIGVETEAIYRLEGRDGCLRDIVFKDGRKLRRTALFFTTGQHLRSPLLSALGCAFDDKGGVQCDAEGRTNVPRLYVAGDVSRDVQLAVVAAAEGARAALAINKDLLTPLEELPALSHH
jgi:thioredoxin reductase